MDQGWLLQHWEILQWELVDFLQKLTDNDYKERSERVNTSQFYCCVTLKQKTARDTITDRGMQPIYLR